jgi:RHS repeat-associated protein
MMVMSLNSAIVQETHYDPWGLELTGLGYQYGGIKANKYLYNGKELIEDNGLQYYDYGARMYDPAIGRWGVVDPLTEITMQPYSAFNNNPIYFIDPDGRMAVPPSTHLDDEGNVVAVFNDGDNGVYQHGKNADGGSVTEYQLSKRAEKQGTSSGGTKVGETEYWDEFVSPETGKTMTNTRVQVGKSFDPIISKMNAKSKGMNLMEIAQASKKGQLFDIKTDYANVGALLNGKYATSRSAGNFLAGYNAEGGTMMGVGISFTTFQKLAGALHIENSHGKSLSRAQMLDIVTLGTYIGSDMRKFVAPTFGEVNYQYRQSRAGWKFGEN